MRFDILTLFPGFFDSPLKQSILGKAIESGVVEVYLHNIRDYAGDKHSTADDTPYGGGAGMVMKVEPAVKTIEAVKKESNSLPSAVILTTPQGERLSQRVISELSKFKRLIIVCGRYEGMDDRIRAFVDMEVSLGDYVVTGGEIAALCMVDAVSRFVPGVLGDSESLRVESFADGLLEYPQYTRPEEFRGLKVPGVLLSGNHAEIQKWRRKESLKRTLERRPDMIEDAALTDEDKKLIKELTGGN